jgi:hypothetical protein
MKLGDFIIKQEGLTAKVEFRDNIIFTLRYVSRNDLRQINQRCLVWKYDPVLKGKTQQLDAEKFATEFCVQAVADWEGVTLKSLSKLLPIKLEGVSEEMQNMPIPFTPDNLMDLVKNAYEVDAFLQEMSTDVKVFNPDKEQLEKNLSSSQSGS